MTLVTASKDDTPSLGVKLLQDVKTVFGDRSVMFTEDLLRALNSMDEAPWGDLRGSPLGCPPAGVHAAQGHDNHPGR